MRSDISRSSLHGPVAYGGTLCAIFPLRLSERMTSQPESPRYTGGETSGTEHLVDLFTSLLRQERKKEFERCTPGQKLVRLPLLALAEWAKRPFRARHPARDNFPMG